MIPRVIAFDLGGVLVKVDKSPLFERWGDRAYDAFFGPRHRALATGRLSASDYIEAAAAVLDCTPDVARRAWCDVVHWASGGFDLWVDVADTASVRFWSNVDPLHWAILGLGAFDEPEHHLAELFCPAAMLPGGVAVPDDRVAIEAAVSFRLGLLKPDPAFFALALRGLDPQGVLYLDDDDDNVAAAASFGVDAVVCRGVEAARTILIERGALPSDRHE